jgi:hypothetical protein
VEFGQPISFLIIVVLIPFLYVLFGDIAIKDTLLTWGLAVLYALAGTRMEGHLTDDLAAIAAVRPELPEHIKQAIKALVKTAIESNSDGENSTR